MGSLQSRLLQKRGERVRQGACELLVRQCRVILLQRRQGVLAGQAAQGSAQV